MQNKGSFKQTRSGYEINIFHTSDMASILLCYRSLMLLLSRSLTIILYPNSILGFCFFFLRLQALELTATASLLTGVLVGEAAGVTKLSPQRRCAWERLQGFVRYA